MKENTTDVELVNELSDSIQKLKNEIAKIIVGQNKIIDDLIVSLLCKGHCLLVGVPGLAKTLLIKTLAEVLDLNFSRIQFTPDLMPGDITGTEIIDEDAVTRKRSFRFIKGPLFSNLILADEINRTPPKTQAALLESMQEYKITAAGTSYKLEQPFFVLATQNPIEQEGTYPLPEAQLDRFMFSLWLDYPSFQEEVEIIKSTTGDYFPNLEKVVTKSDLIKFQELIKRVPVSDNVIEHAVKLVAKTRPEPSDTLDSNNLISWGAGPRASQFLILAAKAKAVIEGRYTPSIEDVNTFLIPVLRHRIIPSFNAQADGIDSVAIINKLTNAN